MNTLKSQPLTAEAFAPYGWMLGKSFPGSPGGPAYSNPATDFWREHLFESGAGGEPEILWVNYRNSGPVSQLEVHTHTQQAIVPLTGPIVHIVACSLPDGTPDLATLAAFSVSPGVGLCMAQGCWHATRVPATQATCLMLTRRSTTLDLVSHLHHGTPANESRLVAVPPISWQA